jgi:DNA-binding beta-propeller fold protein YncE
MISSSTRAKPLVVGFGMAVTACLVIAGPADIQLRQTIPLPGVEGRIDHFDCDAAGERLFVCALGNNSVEVIDLHKGERVHSITGLGAPQGIAYVPGLNRLFVADDQNGLVKIFDAKSFQSLGQLSFDDNADNLRYDDSSKQVYVGFGGGGIGIINALDGKRVSSIALAAHPEAFVLEKNEKRIFANVPTSRHVAIIDRDKAAVTSKWGTGRASGNFPMALDETNHRLFVGCRLPPNVVVLDTESGKLVTTIAIPGDVDDLFYDGKRHRIYAICGAGKIDVIEQSDANNYRTAFAIDTAEGARTGLFLPERDNLFVAVPHRGSQSAEVRCYEIKQ